MHDEQLEQITGDTLFILANTCPQYSYTAAGICVTDSIMQHWGQTAETFLQLSRIEFGGEYAQLRGDLRDQLAILIGTKRADKAMTHVADHIDSWD
tara:strand:+ start:1600 stop:1887 length:288 start_codon:yes stop_codon:yes gene_type:complete